MSYTIEYQLTLEDYKEAWQPLIQKRGNSLPRLAAFAVFMLHLSEQTFYVVPKRAFADETQRDEFRSLLKNIDAAQATQQPPLPAP